MSNPYDYAIDPNGDTTANKVLRFVASNARVLELGTAAGVMSRELHRRGCRVTGVEYVPEMASQAEQWCERMIVADLDTLDFGAELAGERFDVVVAADVLEHLRAPQRVLAALLPLMSEAGRLVISVPNVAYAGLVAGLLSGNFRYREKGLLDRTHLRFFTRRSLEWMLLENGWVPLQWDAYHVPVHASEFATDWLRLHGERARPLETQPDADVYQFVVVAAPAGERATTARLQAEIASLEAELQGEKSRHFERITQHERDLEALREHQKAFAEARDTIASLGERVHTLESAVRPAWMDPADRRLLCVAARGFHRLARWLGGA